MRSIFTIGNIFSEQSVDAQRRIIAALFYDSARQWQLLFYAHDDTP